MSRVVLIRHGQSEWNALRRIQGHSGTGLSELGLRQAEIVAGWVAAGCPNPRLVTSDLQRCLETVAPIAAAVGVEPIEDPRLRERSFGRWEGRTLAEAADLDPGLHARWCVGEDILGEIGGETGDLLAERVVAALQEHAAGAELVVAVTHGGSIWHGVHTVLDLPPRTLGGVGNTAVTELGYEDGRWWLETWNQTSHLPADLRTSFRPSEQRTPARA